MIRRLFFTSKEIKSKMPMPHKLIDRHYVYEYSEDKVLILTTRPLEGIKNHVVSSTNITGEHKTQYVSGHYHTDKTSIKLKEVSRGQKYYSENAERLRLKKRNQYRYQIF